MSGRSEELSDLGEGVVVLAGSKRLPALVARFEPHLVRSALIEAREQFGHALCLCVAPPRKLVVRERLESLHLAVWPEDGHHHHHDCPFWREPMPVAEIGAGLTPAVVETPSGMDVKVETSFVRSDVRHQAKAETDGVQAADAESKKPGGRVVHSPIHQRRAALPLQSLLHLVWTRADLHKWRRGWARDYWRCYTEIQAATHELSISAKPMSDLALVVRPWRDDQSDAIRDEWQMFLSDLAFHDGDRVPSRLIIGEVKDITQSPHGFKLRLRHLRDPIYMDSDTYGALRRQNLRASTAIQRFEHDEPSERHERVMAMLQVERTRSAKGNLRLVDAALLLTNAFYLPVNNSAEGLLANTLIHGGRHFVKPLSGGLSGVQLEADFMLRDTRPHTALLISTTSSLSEMRECERRGKLLEAAGYNVWHWTSEGSENWPSLPPATPPY